MSSAFRNSSRTASASSSRNVIATPPSSRLRLVFAGTPPFAACALRALCEAGHQIALVLTQPDRPSGRGLRRKPSAVATTAGTLGLEVVKPSSLKSAEALAPIAAADPDVLVVAAYGLILPQAVLAIPRRGCLNIHASLLPRWRGAAPVQRAIEAGDAETGVAIMAMEAGLDTGPVLLQRKVPILDSDTGESLTKKLAALGAQAIVEALAGLDSFIPAAQDDALATYAAKIERREARLDWQRDAIVLDRRIRAFDPFPGTETTHGGETIKIWGAKLVELDGRPGEVIGVDQGRPIVACGRGALVLTYIQRPGSQRMPAAEFVKGRPMPPGSRLGSGGPESA